MSALHARKRVIALADSAEQRLLRSRGRDTNSLGGELRTGLCRLNSTDNYGQLRRAGGKKAESLISQPRGAERVTN
jgi:hypothetical protein